MTASLTVDSFALAAACLAGVAAASLPMASLAAPLLSQRLLLLSPRPRGITRCGFSRCGLSCRGLSPQLPGCSSIISPRTGQGLIISRFFCIISFDALRIQYLEQHRYILPHILVPDFFKHSDHVGDYFTRTFTFIQLACLYASKVLSKSYFSDFGVYQWYCRHMK